MAVSNLGSFEFELASFLCSAYQYAYLMSESKGVWLALQLILKSKGLVRVYRGIGAGPAHAMYFWFMRYIRKFSLVAT